VAEERHPFKVEVERADGKTIYRVSGTIDEHADLDQLEPRPDDTDIEVDLRDVHRFNSYGVRAWIYAMRRMHADGTMRFVHCPPLVIDQLNMVDGLMGRAEVASFYAPRSCSACDVRTNQFLEVAACHANGGKLPALPCPECGAAMELDDIEEKYEFLLRNNPPSSGA
jgi:hypothetical protein